MIKVIVVGFGSAICWFLGGCDAILICLIAFVVIDFITGISAAAVKGVIASSVGKKGIAKKVFIFVLVGVAHIFDSHVIDSDFAVRNIVVAFYLFEEFISIIENIASIGVPVPKILIQIINKSKGAVATADDIKSLRDQVELHQTDIELVKTIVDRRNKEG